MKWPSAVLENHHKIKQKLAPCGTDGRLLLRGEQDGDGMKQFFEGHISIFFQVQSHVTQKLGETSEIRPEQI